MENREIKFRAWDKLNKEMWSDNVFPSLFWKIGSEIISINDFAEGHIKENVVFMQYTRLKDKKGVEIYEGDILSDGKGANGIIEYKRPQFVVWADNQHFALAEGKINMVQLEYTEVIGNIYENPELLK